MTRGQLRTVAGDVALTITTGDLYGGFLAVAAAIFVPLIPGDGVLPLEPEEGAITFVITGDGDLPL